MSTEHIAGEIPGNPPGTAYANRMAAKDAGVHTVTVQGIAGNRDTGAVSIVVNGGYEDDEDHGDEIVYTGAGGNDPGTGKQVANQELSYFANAALVVSEEQGLPVRVIRGPRGDEAHSPGSGYRYDGLFRVVEHWSDKGKSGFLIWRFRLLALDSSETVAYVPTSSAPIGNPFPAKAIGVVQRTVRATKVSQYVKRMYADRCQVCGQVLELPVGRYSEGAHIRALGSPHNGPDTVDNILCLCPNHHVLFDKGAIYLDDDLVVRDRTGATIGGLTVAHGHDIDLAHIASHRARFGIS